MRPLQRVRPFADVLPGGLALVYSCRPRVFDRTPGLPSSKLRVYWMAFGGGIIVSMTTRVPRATRTRVLPAPRLLFHPRRSGLTT
jgi:hypothetical protein